MYAVIFVDLGLPGTRGEDVVQRAAAMRPGVPVVVCTGESVESVPGAVAVVRKPFKPSALVEWATRLVSAEAPSSEGPTRRESRHVRDRARRDA